MGNCPPCNEYIDKIANLIQAGYKSFKVEPKELIESTKIHLQQQKPAVQIEIIGGQKPIIT
ncbi:hypothetical protein [Scytonema millei]|uniref:Uncharacterized protein n=1 Tax=Scytonema millei VB511283 TaxID=1245923 RepID=A0A9X5I120_9CYAN|nr:hypothetical protein [Scytonema millei]NHC33103.1 hypothetical protein [Scytonema millei VB511283]